MNGECFRIATLLGVFVGLATACGPRDILLPVGNPQPQLEREPVGPVLDEPQVEVAVPADPDLEPGPDPVDVVEPEVTDAADVDEFPGGSGSLRFHLKFNNETLVDLDLHVMEPGGEEINYLTTKSSNDGQLDVDCLCGVCPRGPYENIFWPDEVHLPGEYIYWVNYFGSCEGSGEVSNYTLYVFVDDEVVRTHEGTLLVFPTEQFRFVHE